MRAGARRPLRKASVMECGVRRREMMAKHGRRAECVERGERASPASSSTDHGEGGLEVWMGGGCRSGSRIAGTGDGAAGGACLLGAAGGGAVGLVAWGADAGWTDGGAVALGMGRRVARGVSVSSGGWPAGVGDNGVHGVGVGWAV